MQHLSCGGRNRCDICHKKRRKNYKRALFIQIAIQLKFVGPINTFPAWCIVKDGPTRIRKFVLSLTGGALPRALCPVLLYMSVMFVRVSALQDCIVTLRCGRIRMPMVLAINNVLENQTIITIGLHGGLKSVGFYNFNNWPSTGGVDPIIISIISMPEQDRPNNSLCKLP